MTYTGDIRLSNFKLHDGGTLKAEIYASFDSSITATEKTQFNSNWKYTKFSDSSEITALTVSQTTPIAGHNFVKITVIIPSRDNGTLSWVLGNAGLIDKMPDNFVAFYSSTDKITHSHSADSPSISVDFDIVQTLVLIGIVSGCLFLVVSIVKRILV